MRGNLQTETKLTLPSYSEKASCSRRASRSVTVDDGEGFTLHTLRMGRYYRTLGTKIGCGGLGGLEKISSP